MNERKAFQVKPVMESDASGWSAVDIKDMIVRLLLNRISTDLTVHCLKQQLSVKTALN